MRQAQKTKKDKRSLARRRLDAQPTQYPTAIERRYRRELLTRVRAIGRIVKSEIDELLLVEGAEIDDLARQDTQEEVVRAIVRKIGGIRLAVEGQWTEREDRDLARRLGEQTAAFETRQIERQFSAVLGVDPILRDQAVARIIDDFVAENLQLIRNIGPEITSQVEEHLITAVREGQRAEDFQEIVAERLGVGESRARLIARDQIGSMTGRITEARHRELGVTKFIWSSSQDERVRELHVERDGQEFSWDHTFDETPDDGPPGRPINCRCVALPVIDKLI